MNGNNEGVDRQRQGGGARQSDGLRADLSALGATALVLVLALGLSRISHERVALPEDGAPVTTANPSSESDPQPPPPAAKDGGAAASPAAKAGRHLNVILITVDTLRADLGFTGYPRPVSPNIDALAARSLVYDHAYALASYTPKCLGPLLIGRYASETNRDPEHYTAFLPQNTFVAERVVAGGGRTFGVASHRYFGWKKGFDQGFDVWDTSPIPPNSVDNDPTITSATVTDAAIALLSSPRAGDVPVRKQLPTATRSGHASDHFFAWIHYLDPHLPYVFHQGAPAFAAMPGENIPKQRAPYDGEVWFTDQQVGRLLAHIEAQPWAAETAIILTADHGEAFGERGHWGHGREVWEPLVRVPLVVYVPGQAPRAIHVKRSHIDVVPTIVEWMGLEPDANLRGTSLMRDVDTANAKPVERDVYIDMPEGPFNEMRRAIITGPSPGTKLIDFGGRYELFDLEGDPAEAKNLASDAAALGAAKEAMTRVRASLREIPPTR